MPVLRVIKCEGNIKLLFGNILLKIFTQVRS